MDCISPPFTPLHVSLCIPLSFLEYFIGEIRGYDNPDAQPNPPNTYQNPLPVYNSISEFTPDNFWIRGEKYEQVISFKGDSDRRNGNGAKYIASLLQF